MTEDSKNRREIKETWIRNNELIEGKVITPLEIKKDLVTNLTLPNFQHENPYHHYGEILGYSVHSELIVEDNYKNPNSFYQTTIKIKTYFIAPEEVPSKTELKLPKKLLDFLLPSDETKRFKRIA